MVFNTPGANANAVKELVLCAMLMGSRDVDGGIQWVRQQVAAGVDVTTVVEKGKAAFIGPELYKKSLGVIGLGAIGSLVANIALSLGMDVYGYDPYLSVDAALRLDRHIHVVKDINELYKRADYITIHIHYTKETEHMIDAKAIGAMKRGVRFINLARGRDRGRRRHAGGPGYRLGGGLCDGLPQQPPGERSPRASPCPTWGPPHRRVSRTAPSWRWTSCGTIWKTATSATA